MNMIDGRITKQVLDFQKSTFDNAFNMMSMLQDQTEKTFSTFLETGMWPIPEEEKEVINEWVQSLKKGREEFKKVMDEGFQRVEGYFAQEKTRAQ